MRGGWFQRAVVAICALGASLGMCSPDLPAGAGTQVGISNSYGWVAYFMDSRTITAYDLKADGKSVCFLAQFKDGHLLRRCAWTALPGHRVDVRLGPAYLTAARKVARIRLEVSQGDKTLLVTPWKAVYP